MLAFTKRFHVGIYKTPSSHLSLPLPHPFHISFYSHRTKRLTLRLLKSVLYSDCLARITLATLGISRPRRAMHSVSRIMVRICVSKLTNSSFVSGCRTSREACRPAFAASTWTREKTNQSILDQKNKKQQKPTKTKLPPPPSSKISILRSWHQVKAEDWAVNSLK